MTLLPFALLAAGCGSKQNALSPESPSAHGIATIWWIMLAGSVLGLGVIVAILVAAWFKRGVEGADRPGTITVIALGIVTPILVLAALFAYSDIFLIRGTSPPDTRLSAPLLGVDQNYEYVHVVGHQFWWEVRYGGNLVTANEIHIPVRTHVIVYVHSDDVIHSFWVPQLNRKIDLEPDQVNRVELYADKPGRYRGQCAEFCGLQHAHMGFYVIAQPFAQFARWARAQSKPAKRFNALFDDKCGSCHAIRGTPAHAHVGPDLTHVGSRTSLAALTIPNTPAHMADWLRNTQQVKPGSKMPDLHLTDGQVRQLTRYLESLK